MSESPVPLGEKRHSFFKRRAGSTTTAATVEVPVSPQDLIRVQLRGWLEPAQVEAVVGSHDLGNILVGLVEKSVDASTLYAAVGASGTQNIAASEQQVRQWIEKELEQRGGERS